MKEKDMSSQSGVVEKNKSLFEKYHVGLFIFVLFYLIFTFLSFKDFPITTDEQFRYQRGQEMLDNYLNSKYLQTFIFPDKEPDTYYFYVMLLNILNPNFYYEWFHLQNMIFGLIGFITIYFLVFSYTKNPFFSTLGPIFLFLIPGYSGLIPANPIDGPFASLVILNIFLIYYFRNEGFTFKKIITLGFSFWLLLGIRPVGYQFFLHFIVFGLFFSDRTIPFWNKLLLDLKTIVLIFFVASFLSVISWPYLGINYFKNFPGILFVNSKYDKWDLQILFNGSFVTKEDRPWNYLFTYILFTLPFFILAPLTSPVFNLKSKLKQFVTYILLFNLTLYLILQPVIYNGLRHFLYLIPIICAMSLFSLWDFLNSKLSQKIKIFGLIPVFLSIFWTLFEVWKMYPNHYAYFNEISGGFRKNYNKYETEYWGGLYKEGAIYIRDNLSGKNPSDLKVFSCNLGYSVDYYSHKKFSMAGKLSEADIIICDFVENAKNNFQGRVIKEIKLHDVPYIFIRENELKKINFKT